MAKKAQKGDAGDGVVESSATEVQETEAEKAQREKNEEAVRMQAEIDAREASKKAAEEQAALDYAAKLKVEREEAEKLRPLPPVIGTTSAEVAQPNEPTVLMEFPKPVVIWAKDNKGNQIKVGFQKGVQKVPESMKDNWYLAVNGVRAIEK